MNSDEVLRAFVAVEVDDATRRESAAFQATLREAGAALRWVRPDALHLTLVFFGDIFGAQVPAIAGVLDEETAGVAPLPLAVRGVGTFGPPAALRVLWAGVEGDTDRLLALHAALTRRFRALGHRVEERPYTPHLTLARAKPARRGGGAPPWTAALAAQRDRPFGAFTVGRLLLMRSVLGRDGPEYTAVHVSPFDTSRGVPV
jgi:RNA 2',3'-cyclic 3'-phosphodiesterase